MAQFFFFWFFFGWRHTPARPSPPVSVFPELTGALEFIDDFLLLYAPVLKPDCHLSLCQVCLRGYPPPFVLGDEFIGGVLPFQFLELHLGVWHTLLSPTANRAVSTRYSVCGERNAWSHYHLLWTASDWKRIFFFFFTNIYFPFVSSFVRIIKYFFCHITVKKI